MSKIIAYLVLSFLTIGFDNFDEEAQNYIETYSELAVIEMYRTGIPASITLAQGLHESNYGQSRLATNANNHFGIKCKSYWQGKTYFHKDDDLNARGELIKSCFRSYESVYDSYIDHSNFLQYSFNYQELFELDKKDYKSWAKGLQNAGYATDKRYAEKLINFIEKYQLYVFDNAQDPYNRLRKIKTYESNY